MVNRFMLLGAGAALAAVASGFVVVREYLAARAHPETVVALAQDDAAAKAEQEAAKAAQDIVQEQETLLAKPTMANGTVIYACEEGKAFAVKYGESGGDAEITFNGGSSRLQPVFVAEGVQFSDGFVTLRSQGEMAAVAIGETIAFADCKVDHAATKSYAAKDGPPTMSH